MSTIRTTNVIHGSSAISNIVLDNQGRAIFGPNSPAGRAALYVNAQNNRVGVNTESPGVELDVDGQISATGNATVGGTLNVTGGVTFGGNTTIDGTLAVTDDFSVNTDSIFVDASLDSVGIGTTTFTATAAGRNILELAGGNGGALLNLTTNGTRRSYFFGGQTNTFLYNTQAGNLELGTNNVTRLWINSTGKVGIVKAPNNNWQASAVSSVLQLNNSVLFDFSGVQLDVGRNYYYDGTNYRYIVAGDAQRIAFFDEQIIFNSASDGSADAPFTWTDYGRFDSDGRLLINTTAARTTVAGGAAQLEVEGTSTDSAGISVVRTSNNSGGCTLSLGKTRNGAIVQNNDVVGTLFWQADNGTNLNSSVASIESSCDGVSGSSIAGRLIFSTSNSLGALTQQWRLDSGGNLRNDFGSGAYGLLLNTASAAGCGITFQRQNVAARLGTIACESSTYKLNTSQTGGWHFQQINAGIPTSSEIDRVTIDVGDGQIRSNQTTILALTSERRTKENIVAIDPTVAWETIKSVPYYSYNYLSSPNSVAYGAIVDEVPEEMIVQPMNPDEDGVMVANADEEGPLRTYDNGMLQARLYTALQTALGRIEDLESRIATLENN